jgi:xanthine/uracil permease
MSPVFQLLPLVIILALYAVYFRLAARVLRASRVDWLYAIQFSALVVVITIAGRLASSYFGELPLLLGMLFGLALHLALGAWFFRERALAPDGQSLGWVGGAKLTAVAFAFLFATLAVLVGGVRALLSVAAP